MKEREEGKIGVYTKEIKLSALRALVRIPLPRFTVAQS